MSFPGGAVVDNLPANAGDVDSIPGSGRSSGRGNGNPFRYYCLEKSHGQKSPAGYSSWGHTKNLTRLSDRGQPHN